MVIFISLIFIANRKERMRKPSLIASETLGYIFTLGGTNSLLTGINVICKNHFNFMVLMYNFRAVTLTNHIVQH